jgi:cell division protein FtsI/penicillin-binding protein 2
MDVNTFDKTCANYIELKNAIDKAISDNMEYCKGHENASVTVKLMAIIKNQAEKIKDMKVELESLRSYDYRSYAPLVWHYPGYPGSH